MSEGIIARGLVTAACLLAVTAQVACRPGLKGGTAAAPTPEPTQEPGPLALVNAIRASASAYTGSVWAVQPVFGFFNGSSTMPRTDLSGSINIEAFLNPSCNTPADGTFSVSQNPMSLSSGLAAFSGISYALPGHLEQKLYLKASESASGLSVCTSGTSIRHPFRAGFGYVHSSGTTVGGNSSFPVESLHAVAVDAQGRLVVAGDSNGTGGGSKLAIWRYNPDGTLDTSFGGAGYAVSGAVSAAGGNTDSAKALALDPNGRLVIAGTSTNAASGYEFALWRYNPDGTPDTSFSGDGRLSFGPTSATGNAGAASFDFALTLVIDGEGRLVAGGNSMNAAGGRELVLWRYNADGTPDTTFGGGDGYVTSGPTGAAGATGAAVWDRASTLLIDPEGRHLITGYSAQNATVRQLVIWRYTADGALDTSFGGGTGYVLGPTPGPGGAAPGSQVDRGYGLKLDAQGRIVIAGYSKNAVGGFEMSLWRFTAEGELDLTFGGGNGMVAFGSPNAAGHTGVGAGDTVTSLEIDGEGRLVIAGASTNADEGTQLAIWRYTADGSRDLTFGAGKGFVTFGPNAAAGATGEVTYDMPWGMALDGEGRIVLAGESTDPDGYWKAAIWRYLPDGTPDK